MRKIYLLATLLVYFDVTSQAQSILIDPTGNNGAATNFTQGVIFSTSSNSKSSSRFAFIYPKTQLGSLVGGDVLNSIELFKSATNAALSGNYTMRIYLKNTTASSVSAATTWAAETAGAVRVYYGFSADVINRIGTTFGFRQFPFSQLFTYTGDNLELLVEYSQNGGSPVNIFWQGFDAQYYMNNKPVVSSATGVAYPTEFSGTTDWVAPTLKLNLGTTVTPLSYTSFIVDGSYNYGAGTSDLTLPMYTSNNNDASSRVTFVYPKASLDLLNAGDILNAIDFYKANPSAALTGTYRMKIYLKNTVAPNVDWSSDWATEISGATLVYNGNSASVINNIGTASGFRRFPFSSLFTYTGDNLELLVEYSQSGGTPADIYWANFDGEAIYGYRNAETLNPVAIPQEITGGSSPWAPTIQLSIGAAILPVSLADFKGTAAGAKNLITWTTYSEQNNDRFEIQRAADGKTFITIGTATSKGLNGKSEQALSYNFEDAQPVAGINYYRLRQVDFDGRSSLSGIVTVKAKLPSVNIKVFPNPVHDVVSIQTEAERTMVVRVLITDASGKTVRQTSIEVNKGVATISMPVHDLPSGTYFVRLINADTGEEHVASFLR